MGISTDALIVTGRPWLTFDIETMPMPGCADYLTDPIEAPANYKDPVKIAAWIAEKRAKQIADAALDLDLCEIAAVGLRHSGVGAMEITRGTVSEYRILSDVWAAVRGVYNAGGVLVGFNCLAFDLPILLRRSLYLGVPTPTIQIDKYRHDGVIDVADVLTFGGKTTWRSLGFYAKRFGIPHDDRVKGEDVPALVAAAAWEDIAAHVRADVATTTALAQRIGLISQPQPAEEAAAVA